MLRNRMISLLLSVMMLFSFSGVSVYAQDNENAENKDLIYGNWHFNEDTLPKGLSTYSDAPYTISNGVLTIQPNSSKVGYMTIDKITNEEGTLPEFVLEFKSKVNNPASGSYMSYHPNAALTPMFFYCADTYLGDYNSWCWADRTKTSEETIIDDVTKWHTYAIKFSNKDSTRSLYIDGECVGTSTDASGNTWYANGWAYFRIKLYSSNGQMTSDYEYIKVYSPSDEINIKAYPMSYDLDTLYLEFGTTIVDFKPEMVTVDGITAKSVTLFDEENQVFEVKLSESLQSEQTYDVVINGAKTSLGKTVSDTISFTTRDKAFYIDGPVITDGTDEIATLTSGTKTITANVLDELNEGKSVEVISAQYDSEGFMNKENLFNDTYANGQVSETIDIASNSEKASAFAWEGIDNPVPVSDITTYTLNEKESIKRGFKIPEYSGEAEVLAAIKDDYSGITVTVDTKDTTERIIGLLVKYKGNIEYVDNKRTETGIATFDVPLKEENIGSYNITVGIENGEKISVTPDIEYYSPSYIEQMMETKINAGSADSSTVDEFVTLLAEYMKLDIESLNKLSDKDYAFDRLLSLRDNEENQTISGQERLASLFATAVKMALIYEGTDTADIISKSTDLSIDDKTKQAFSTLISLDAKDYVKDKLKGVTYSLPSDMTNDVKKHTIIGGIYKASHNSILASLINVFGTDLGIDTQNYYTLSDPSKVADKVIKVEYPSLNAFKDAVNSAITEQKNSESVVVPSPVIKPSTGGGGGGGITYSPIPADDKKEEEEIKPAVKKSYSDVTEGEWFYSDVMWATENGWFIGTSDTTFSPENYLTWEQIAIVLKRMGFEYSTVRGNEAILRGDFADVLYTFLADKAKYQNVDEWIKGTKMFIGNDSGNMMFDTPLTRAQCCTLIRRIENK